MEWAMENNEIKGKQKIENVKEKMLLRKTVKRASQTPDDVYRAVLDITCYPAEEIAACNRKLKKALLKEYEVRQDVYESVKLPQTKLVQSNLIADRNEIEKLSRMFFLGDDNENAFRILCCVAKCFTIDILHSIPGAMDPEHVTEEALENTTLSHTQELLLQRGYLHHVFRYIRKYIGWSEFEDLCEGFLYMHIRIDDAERISILAGILEESAKFVEADTMYRNEAFKGNKIAIASYKNDSAFYDQCIDAVINVVNKRLYQMFIINSITKGDCRYEELCCRLKDKPKSAFKDGKDTALPHSDILPQLTIGDPLFDTKIERDLERAINYRLEITEYLTYAITAVSAMVDADLSWLYDNFRIETISKKEARMIINKAFMKTELLGMDISPETDERKKEILKAIAEELVRENLYRAARQVSYSNAAETARPQGKTKSAENEAAKRYEEVLAENIRLKKSLKLGESEKAKEQKYKEREKELRSELAEKKKEMRSLKDEIEKLKEENESLICFFNEETQAEEEPIEECTFDQAKEAVGGKRILVWGCRSEFVRKNGDLFKEITLIDTSKNNNALITAKQLKTYDGVILHTNNCNHSIYNKALALIRNAGIPYIHMKRGDTGTVSFFRSIVDICNRIDRKNDREDSEN